MRSKRGVLNTRPGATEARRRRQRPFAWALEQAWSPLVVEQQNRKFNRQSAKRSACRTACSLDLQQRAPRQTLREDDSAVKQLRPEQRRVCDRVSSAIKKAPNPLRRPARPV